MKKWNRVISLLLCAVMLVSLLPTNIWAEDDPSTATITYTTQSQKTVYVLTSSISSGSEYLIVSRNSSGTGYALKNNSGSVGSTSVTVQYDSTIGTYIELDDATKELWEVGSGYTFKNGNYYLSYTQSQQSGGNRPGQNNQASYTLSLSTSTNNSQWSYSSNRVYRQLGNNNRYVVYSSGWTLSANSSNVYFYVPTSITVNTSASTTYNISANGLVLEKGASGVITPVVMQDGTVLTGDALTGSYSYSIQSGSDVISLGSDGVVNATNEGTAVVRVSYTWTAEDGESHTIYTDVDVTVAKLFYTVDITDTALDSEGNRTSGESITKTVVVKSVTSEKTYDLWAAVYKNGTDEMTATNTDLRWSSSNTAVATVDEDGIVHFTGIDGTTTISVYYEYTVDGQIYHATDRITISASTGEYIVPEDGTDDFPEYPNEGSVRFDKTATAVGNFSDTGIVQMELSMTGVPYTKGAELDVVLVIDLSQSMDESSRLDYAKAAAKAFVESIVVKEDGSYNDNRIAIITFNSTSSTTGTTVYALNTVTDLDAVNDLIDDLGTAQGTNYAAGLTTADSILTAARTDGTGDNRKQFCVFLSDGAPTNYLAVGASSTVSLASGGTSSESWITDSARGTSYQYEHYTTKMKSEGVTVYTVGLGLSTSYVQPNYLLNDMSGPAYETTNDTGSAKSKLDSYYFEVADSNSADKLENVFENIASSIKQAATNVVVQDKISDDFTMIFQLPEALSDDAAVLGLTDQEFYIQVLEYDLDSNKERTTSTTLAKIYLATEDGNFYAASDAEGTAYTSPVFTAVTEGQKGYWTTTEPEDTTGVVTVTVSDTTYYFAKDGSGGYNMTAGAYASGTNNDTIQIATPYFVYDAATRMLVWTSEKLAEKELALNYFLYLNNSGGVEVEEQIEAGTYSTNDYASLTYDNFQEEAVKQAFPQPQMTWNGAQVSYVFYLVNENGQPVNRAGRVVPFSEAVYVTHIFTEAVYWTGLQKQDSLDADILAEELVPEVYELYDKGASYVIHAFADQDGMNQHNHFKISSGFTDTSDTTKNYYTTYVFNTKADSTKYTEPAIYALNNPFLCKSYNVTKTDDGYTFDGETNCTQYFDENNSPVYGTDATGTYTIVYKSGAKTVAQGFDFYNTTVAFAVIWKPELVEDTVVIDYGLDVDIDVTLNDGVSGSIVGIMANAPTDPSTSATEYGINIGHFNLADLPCESSLEFSCGNVSYKGSSVITFSPNDATGMQMNAPIKFYYVYEINYYEGTTLTTEYMYSSVTIIPATTMYFEENFVSYGGTVSSDPDTQDEYTLVGWSAITDGETYTGIQQTDRPGKSMIGPTFDADNLYGYDGAYDKCTTYSLGAAMKTTVDESTYATANFTFIGTGFDLIGLTSNDTGTIIIEIVDGNGTAVGDPILVDTYYGYKLVNGEWTAVTNTPDTIWQVPVANVRDLAYGKYSVTVTVAYNEEHDHPDADSYDFYLDAVRIYDPTGAVASNSTTGIVAEAYIADGEWSPEYEEVRNELLAQFGAYSMVSIAVVFTDGIDETDTFGGPVFIDGNPSTDIVQDYAQYGPNNELYLAPGQALAILVDSTYRDNVAALSGIEGVADIQFGLKIANGSSVSVEISSYADASATTASKVKTMTLSTATDMYYSLLDYYSGVMVIRNTGSGVLSLTDIKVTFAPEITAAADDEVSTDTGASGTDNTSNTSTGFLRSVGDFFVDCFRAVIITVANISKTVEDWFSSLANAIYG